MADITWTDVTDIASELSVISSAARTMILALVNDHFDVEVFPDGEAGAKLKLARVYLAAHHGALGKKAGGFWTGEITGESADGLARQYASNSPMGTDALLDKTPYGQLLRWLIRSLGLAGFVV